MAKFFSFPRLSRQEREPLHFLLDSARADAPLAERLRWMESLIRWVRTAPMNQHEFDTSTGALHNARVRFLLQVLDRHPDWAPKFGATVGSLLHDTFAFQLLARAGLNRERGFVAEALERVLRGVLPRPAEERDLSDLFLRLFDDPTDAAWVENLSPETWDRIAALVTENSPHVVAISLRWNEEVGAAMAALGARVATLGTGPEVLVRIDPSSRQMPFLHVNMALADLARASAAGKITEPVVASAEHAIAEARGQTSEIFESLEQSGASVGLVYTLENIDTCLKRASLLVATLTAPQRQRGAITRELLATLVRESVEKRSFRALVRANVRLVARKITERTGASGEHYIARNRTEYFAMLRAGLGGGCLMVFTTLCKLSIHAAHFPLFGEFVLFSLNYSGSFLLLQILGFTLATKQPSATAAALAAKLESLGAEGEIREFVDEACRMARTQIAALVGNLTLLVPLAIGLDFAWVKAFGHHIVPSRQALGIVQSLDPLLSFTLVNAALTGVMLWLSSIAAGWLENSVVYRNIPIALATNRTLVRVFGDRRANRIGDWTLRYAALIGGNVTLGFLMGALSILGPFFGLPIDVRHVTLSAASLTFASSSLLTGGADPWFLPAPILGVLLVGAINFAVAYSLAFLLATRARDLPPAAEERLLRAIRFRLRNRPLDFFFPRERKHLAPATREGDSES